MNPIRLKEADRVEISILVDNYSDFLLSDTPHAKRLRVPPPNALLAEHGLASLVTVYAGGVKHTILMDAGISGECLNHNAAMLAQSAAAAKGVIQHRIEEVEALVLSHGHFDHFSGLPAYLARAERKLTMVAHPLAFAQRRVKMGPDAYFPLPTLDAGELEAKGVTIDLRTEASTLAGDLILVAGQVARVTAFEKGTPGMEAYIDGEWKPDPFWDDQAIAVNLKGKGLVVMGGCSHAGIINTIKHLCSVSQIRTVHAVLGGFHLTGANNELIEATIAGIRQIAPEVVAPMHCTGWKAINAFADQMPEQFILNTVGTTYIF